MVVIKTLIVLSVLIIIHEFGHYLLAVFSKCEVRAFSLGFGPKLIKKKIGKTEFSISLIPFGGYVKLFGESEEEREKSGSFFLLPYKNKFFISIAGPFFNFIFGFLLLFFLFLIYGTSEITSDYVQEPDKGTSAYSAGFQKGDRIIKIDGEEFKKWQRLFEITQNSDTHYFLIQRGKDTLTLSLVSTWNSKKGVYETGLFPLIPPVAGKIKPNSPAFKAGILEGDTILSINGEKITDWEEMVNIVEKNPGIPIIFEIKRLSEILKIELIPETLRINEEKIVGKVGIYAPLKQNKYNIFESFILALVRIFEIIFKTFAVIGGLILRKVPLTSVGGPIMIGKLIGETAQAGLSSLISFVAFISVQLALINLLPIPALDGGYLLIFTVEKIRGKALSKKIQIALQMFGIIALISFAVIITYLDILRVFLK